VSDEIKNARTIVETAITRLGLEPSSILTKESADHVAWTLKRGSAAVLVALILRGDSAALRVVSPTIVFDGGLDPAKKDALFSRLLELNADGMQSCAFGVIGQKIVVVSERPTSDLDVGEVEHAIRHVAAISDTYDDKLVTEFGGTRASDV
jgi:hypothetical protein